MKELSAGVGFGIVAWARVVLASSLGWTGGTILGFLAMLAVGELPCPEEHLVSGQCTVPWIQWLERGVLLASAVLTGALVVGCAVIAAGELRRERATQVSLVFGCCWVVITCAPKNDATLWALGGASILGMWMARRAAMNWIRADRAQDSV